MTTLQDIFTTGINATRDVLVARASNDPLPNSRGANDVSAPAGSPAWGIGGGSFSPVVLLLVAGIGVMVYILARK
jgi:hypothetical protein